MKCLQFFINCRVPGIIILVEIKFGMVPPKVPFSNKPGMVATLLENLSEGVLDGWIKVGVPGNIV
jgi:hypothetical protein